MKLRECIETIENMSQWYTRNRYGAIEDLLTYNVIVDNETISYEIENKEYYWGMYEQRFYELNIKGLSKLEALKKRNKFERRLIKIAEASK